MRHGNQSPAPLETTSLLFAARVEAAPVIEEERPEADGPEHDLAAVGVAAEHEVGAAGVMEEIGMMREDDAQVAFLPGGKEAIDVGVARRESRANTTAGRRG